MKTINRCDICNKFRKWEDLTEFSENFWNYTFDEADQRDWNECRFCSPEQFTNNNEENETCL